MRIERHVFGSFSGYTTLARSSGVSPEDGRNLESAAYTFGQSHDRGYLKSLLRHPAYFTRALPGGRRGLARLLEGTPDDNNRPTLRLITLITSQRDWDTLLCGDVGPLLDDRSLWEWDGASALPPLDVTLPAPTCTFSRKTLDKMLALISETEKAVAGRRNLIVSNDEFSYAELRALEMLIPPAARRQVTSACRALSNQLPVSVNSLASEAGAQARAGYRYVAGANHLSPYANYLAATELATGTIPVEAVARYQQFGVIETRPAATGAAVAAAPRMTPPSVPVRGRQTGLVWPLLGAAAIAVVLSAGMFVVGKSLGSSATLAIERGKQEDQRQQQDQALNAALAAQNTTHEDRLKKAMDVGGNSYDDVVTASAAKLQDARNAAITSAHDSAGERDRYRSAYEGEFNRQRQRFDALRKEASAALAVNDIRKMGDAAVTLTRIEAELRSLADDWPAVKEEDRKWLAELQETKQHVHEAGALASNLARVSTLLESCEDTVRVADGKAAVNLTADVEEVADLVGQVPGKSQTLGVDIAKFKVASMARADKIRHWLADQEKLAKASVDPSKDPSAGANRGNDWWLGLSTDERKGIRERWEKYQHDHPNSNKGRDKGKDPDKNKDPVDSGGSAIPAGPGRN